MKEIKRPNKPINEKIGEAVDKVIGIVNPQAGYRRAAFRRATGFVSGFRNRISAGSYRGAEKSRLRADWMPGAGSPDQDILPELQDLRDRSRDLNRNDGTATGITNTIVVNDIGTGIKPQSRIDKESLEITDAATIRFQKAAERVWEKWVPFADAGNRMDFYELQALVDRQVLENGEIILLPLMIKEVGRPYSLVFDLIEADRLATPMDLKSDKSIRDGVKIGDRGEPLSYWIRKTHPGEMKYRDFKKSTSFIEIPAKNKAGRINVIHLYHVLRPGQTRGVPFFAPVLTYFKDMADYLEAEIIAARIAACFSIFITKTGDASDVALARTSETNAAGQRLEYVEPGVIEHLAQGEDIHAFEPKRPGDNFDPFINRVLRIISAALNLPYEIVAKDFSQTNYSSARAALLEARRYFRMRQEWLAKKFCQPAWNMLLEEAWLRGELPAAGFYENFLDWTRARWITPGWSWVDPVKEVIASQKAVDMGISSLADEAAAQGKDYEEVLEQRAREEVKIKELEEKNGIIIKTRSGKADNITIVDNGGKDDEKDK